MTTDLRPAPAGAPLTPAGARGVVVDEALERVGLGERAEAVLGDSQVEDASADGVLVAGNAVLTATRARIRNARGHGVSVERSARAVLTECEVLGSAQGGVYSESTDSVRLVGCAVRDGGDVQVSRPAQHQVVQDNMDTGRTVPPVPVSPGPTGTAGTAGQSPARPAR